MVLLDLIALAVACYVIAALHHQMKTAVLLLFPDQVSQGLPGLPIIGDPLEGLFFPEAAIGTRSAPPKTATRPPPTTTETALEPPPPPRHPLPKRALPPRTPEVFENEDVVQEERKGRERSGEWEEEEEKDKQRAAPPVTAITRPTGRGCRARRGGSRSAARRTRRGRSPPSERQRSLYRHTHKQ